MKVGWYIHHQGAGHLHRFLQLRDRFDAVVGLSSLPRPPQLSPADWVELADDVPVPTGTDTIARGSLHWAPLRHDGLRRRMHRIAEWIADTKPDAFVVDVSVEVAAFVRLMGVPVVWIAQRGRREDVPHRRAYAAASSIIAPWSAPTQHDDLCGPMPAGTQMVGALSRFDGRATSPPPGDGVVLALFGAGGHVITPQQISAAVAGTPAWSWRVLGGPSAAAASSEEVWEALQAADVVVASAGANVVAEIAAARRPAILVPQSRPFDEQLHQARSLVASGLVEAHESWPRAGLWASMLDRARRHDPSAWSILHDHQAGPRIHAAITSVACA